MARLSNLREYLKRFEHLESKPSQPVPTGTFVSADDILRTLSAREDHMLLTGGEYATPQSTEISVAVDHADLVTADRLPIQLLRDLARQTWFPTAKTELEIQPGRYHMLMVRSSDYYEVILYDGFTSNTLPGGHNLIPLRNLDDPRMQK